MQDWNEYFQQFTSSKVFCERYRLDLIANSHRLIIQVSLPIPDVI